MRKLDRENRRLNFIESKVSPDHLVEVLRLHSVIPANTKAVRESLIICHDQPGVTGSAEIF